jgi:hypothetical protein
MIIAVGILAFYFVPWIVALARKSSNAWTVFLVNFFLGWTIIGWLAAILIATTSQTKAGAEIERETLRRIRT